MAKRGETQIMREIERRVRDGEDYATARRAVRRANLERAHPAAMPAEFEIVKVRTEVVDFKEVRKLK